MRTLVLFAALAALPVAAQTRVAWSSESVGQPEARRAATAHVDAVRLDEAARAQAPFALDLLGARHVVVPERVVRRGAGQFSVFGAVRGGGRAVVTVEGAHAVVQLSTPAGEVRVQPRGAGHVAWEPVEAADVDDAVVPPGAPPPGASAAASSSAVDALFPDELHLALFYTPAVAAAVGPGVGAVMQAFADALDGVLANSAVPARSRVVLRRMVDYVETPDLGADLQAFVSPSDGMMDEVHAWRNSHHADLVALITEPPSNYCGIAYLMTDLGSWFAPWAFGVTRRACGGLTFAHEIGHNLGLHHDRYVTQGQGTFPYAYGYTNTSAMAPGQPGFRTVLAYNNACVDAGGTCARIPYLSNPDSLWTGLPMGTAAHENNAQAVRLAVPHAAAWRVAPERVARVGTTSGGALAPVVGCAVPADLSTCRVDAAEAPYTALAVTVAGAGLFYVQGQAMPPNGTLRLYAGAFDPLAPLVGLRAFARANSTAPPQRTWLLGAELAIGTSYTLVVSSEAAGAAGDFGVRVYGPAPVGLIVAGDAGPAGRASSLALSAPSPNPSGASARLTLRVAEAQAVEAVVVDALGREVAVLWRGPVAAGGERVLVVGDLAPGTYAVVVRGERASATRRVTLVGTR